MPPSNQKKDIVAYLKFLESQPKGFVYMETQNIEQKKEPQKNKEQLLSEIKNQCTNCQECPLAQQGRTQVVFGHGTHNAKLMFVGEGPGRDEDKQGFPFVGRAGKLLTKIIEAMSLKREDVYISNVVKCRPPNNRAPLPDESEVCKNLILFREIEIIQPQIICALGSSAVKSLLGDDLRISKARGNFFMLNNTPVMPTYHPAYLLRNPAEKRSVWEDMKKIMAKLEELAQ